MNASPSSVVTDCLSTGELVKAIPFESMESLGERGRWRKREQNTQDGVGREAEESRRKTKEARQQHGKRDGWSEEEEENEQERDREKTK